MSVDCRIILPDNVRVKDVAAVVGVAAGIKPTWHQYNDNTGWSNVPVDVDHTSCHEMVYIKFDNRHVSYFFESEHSGRLLFPKSTAFWCLIGHRLVDFFGGSVDYNDCDEVDINYTKRSKTADKNRPSDGKPWEDFHKRIMNVKPITRDEMENFKGNVGYPSDGCEYNYDENGNMIR